MDKCKWCGMERKALSHWKCGTRLTARGSLIQSYACAEIVVLKSQLEAATEVLQECRDVVWEIAKNNRDFDLYEMGDCNPSWYCPMCNGNEPKHEVDFIHAEGCPRLKSVALLPRLEAATEGI